MIILYILGGILLLLLVVTCIPVFFSFEYRESLSFTLKYGCFDVTKYITPKEKTEKKKAKKPGKKKKTEKKKEPAETEEKTKSNFLKDCIKANGVGGFLGIVKSLLVIITKRVAGIIRAIRLKKCDVYLCVGGDDAAQIAEQYGKICAVLYPAAAVLFKFFHCKNGRTTVDLNYKSTESAVIAEGELMVLPIAVIFEGLRLIVQSVPYILKLVNKKQ